MRGREREREGERGREGEREGGREGEREKAIGIFRGPLLGAPSL